MPLQTICVHPFSLYVPYLFSPQSRPLLSGLWVPLYLFRLCPLSTCSLSFYLLSPSPLRLWSLFHNRPVVGPSPFSSSRLNIRGPSDRRVKGTDGDRDGDSERLGVRPSRSPVTTTPFPRLFQNIELALSKEELKVIESKSRLVTRGRSFSYESDWCGGPVSGGAHSRDPSLHHSSLDRF